MQFIPCVVPAQAGDTYGADARFCSLAEVFFTPDARGYEFRPAPGRRVDGENRRQPD